jgi:hypothetical protein
MVSYSPAILMEGTGHVKIGTFKYIPGLIGKVGNNEVDTGAGLSSIYSEMEIGDYVTDAVSKEFKFIGYRLDQRSSLEISGNILEYSCYYVGMTTADVTAKIEFIVISNNDGNATQIYRKIHEGSYKSSKHTTMELIPGIHEGLRKCIKNFVEDAQREKVL